MRPYSDVEDTHRSTDEGVVVLEEEEKKRKFSLKKKSYVPCHTPRFDPPGRRDFI